jgi:hypothetical protein
MASSYAITLPQPNGLGSTGVLSYDTSNTIGVITYDAVGQGMTSTGANAIQASTTRSVALATGGGIGSIAVCGGSGTFSTTSSTGALVSNQSITLQTSGRPVMMIFCPSDTSGASPGAVGASNSSGYVTLANASTGYLYPFNTFSPGSPGSLSTVDFSVAGAPGTYTYQVVAKNNASGSTYVNYMHLIVYEL